MPVAPLPLAAACPFEFEEVVFFLPAVVTPPMLPEVVTLSFLVFDEEVEPLGVLRITMVDFVPMPVDIWWPTLCPRDSVFK